MIVFTVDGQCVCICKIKCFFVKNCFLHFCTRNLRINVCISVQPCRLIGNTLVGHAFVLGCTDTKHPPRRFNWNAIALGMLCKDETKQIHRKSDCGDIAASRGRGPYSGRTGQ